MTRPPSFADLDTALAALGPEIRQTNPTRSILGLSAEAAGLLGLVKPRRERFAVLPEFDLAAIDRLDDLVARARHAEIIFSIHPRKPSIHETRDEAIALRFRMVSAARHALRHDEELQRRLDGIHRRRTLPTLVSDLRKLADLVELHPDAFAAASTLPEAPAKAARRLADTLVAGDYDPELVEKKRERNAASALLSMALREIRSAARYLFRYEPDLLKKLAATAGRTPRRKSKRDAKTEP